MVTHAELIEVFDEDEVHTLDPEFVAERVADPDARRVLTEVGLPDSIFDALNIGDVSDEPPKTLGGILRGGSDSIPAPRRDDLALGLGMGGVVCLDRADGHVYWYKPGDSESFGLVSPSLDRFVDNLRLLAEQLMDLEIAEADDGDERDELIGAELRRLVARLSPADPAGFESPVMYWQQLILASLRYIAES